MPFQENGLFQSDPAGGQEDIDVTIDDTSPDVATVIPMDDPGNGALGRIVFFPQAGPKIVIETPATVGGIPLFYTARAFHSMISPSVPGTPDPKYLRQYVAVAAATEVTVPNTMIGAPDMVIVAPSVGTVTQGTDWAVTEVSATQFKIRNWDAVNSIGFWLYAWIVHSIQYPEETIVAPPAVVLNGAVPVSVPHGLGRVPDFISVFPYELGGVQPSGLPIMDAPPDANNIYLRNVAGALCNAKVYAQATHSIQL